MYANIYFIYYIHYFLSRRKASEVHTTLLIPMKSAQLRPTTFEAFQRFK